jgi:hypothetical protein
MEHIQIDFKFSKNWKTFFNWHKSLKAKKTVPSWEVQQAKIQSLYNATVPNVVDWTKLWFDLTEWYNKILAKKHEVLWSEQQRQIETLLLNQIKDFNKETFILAYLYKGKAEVDTTKMTYWEALRAKHNLEGDKNGIGGDEHMDKITIVNLNSLIK